MSSTPNQPVNQGVDPQQKLNAAQMLLAAIGLVQLVLDNATQSKLPDQILNPLKSGLQNLLQVHGSGTTYAQLEQLRVKTTF